MPDYRPVRIKLNKRIEAPFDHKPLERFFRKKDFKVVHNIGEPGFSAFKDVSPDEPIGVAYDISNMKLSILSGKTTPYKFNILKVDINPTWMAGKASGEPPVREDGKVQCVHWRSTSGSGPEAAVFFTLDLDRGAIITHKGEALLEKLGKEHMDPKQLKAKVLEIDIGRVLDAIEAGEFRVGKGVSALIPHKKRP